MNLYIISEKQAQWLGMAPKVAGGYVVTGAANLHLPDLPGYIAKLPDRMADCGRLMTAKEAEACLMDLDRAARHMGAKGTMGRLAIGAKEVSDMIRADLESVLASSTAPKAAQ
jgi:hypothetical protein